MRFRHLASTAGLILYMLASGLPAMAASRPTIAVAAEVPGAEMIHLSGDFLTKVFEGPYRDAPKWCAAMSEYVARNGGASGTQYFFYTTCPRCAKHYGKNYVVGVAAFQ